jgi:hypothetical protein
MQDVSMLDTSTMTLGMSLCLLYAARLSRSVDSLSLPPAM